LQGKKFKPFKKLAGNEHLQSNQQGHATWPLHLRDQHLLLMKVFDDM
jgi:hypothetical protein